MAIVATPAAVMGLDPTITPAAVTTPPAAIVLAPTVLLIRWRLLTSSLFSEKTLPSTLLPPFTLSLWGEQSSDSLEASS